ncbi:ApeP family dehydratase [Robbsia andropogonis]|uniref:ApeP family dehydratase n=1 Tax=Robbsia andropogonis TaxID=28092 RepID=UPI000464CEC9|nr:hypothetical protein [Robbsia andropogonis]
MTSFPPIIDCLQHRGPMLLVERILASDDDTIQVVAQVDAMAWYANADGAMPAWIGVELMAQSIGAHIGLRALSGKSAARPGVLLGTRRYSMAVPCFAAASRLVIEAERVLWTEDGQGAYACTIRPFSEGPARPVALAEGVVKVFQPTDFAAFSNRSERQ